MAPLPRPDMIFTHESDLDGFVSGLLLKRLSDHLFGSPIRMEAYHYNSWRQREVRENAAWVADLSFEARLDKPNWVIIDHHATEGTPKNARLIHNIGKSAGLLCYELCGENGISSPELDRIVHLNNVADLFLEDDAAIVLASDYSNLVKVNGFWNIHALLDGKLERILDHPLLEVMAVKRRIEDPLGFEWSRKNVQQLNSSVGLVDTVVGNNNLIVHKLLEKQATPYPVLITLYRRTNGVVIASLRSRNGEALKVAEKLQGGGHANAAGATLPKAVRSIPDAIAYLKRVLDPEPSRQTQLNTLESLFDSIELK